MSRKLKQKPAPRPESDEEEAVISHSDSEQDDSPVDETENASDSENDEELLDLLEADVSGALAVPNTRASTRGPELFVKRKGHIEITAERPGLPVYSASSLPAASSSGASSRSSPGSESGSGSTASSTSAVVPTPDLLANIGKNPDTVPSLNPNKRAREARKNRPQTAGDAWFDLPAQKITPELKQELKMIDMRGYLDPKRFYKKDASRKAPKFFQLGTVIEGAGEFYSSRLTHKERKHDLVGELLHDQKSSQYVKKKFNEIQVKRAPIKRKGGAGAGAGSFKGKRGSFKGKGKGQGQGPKKRQKIERF